VARVVQSRFRDESVNSEALVCIKAHELSATDIFPGDKTRTSIGTDNLSIRRTHAASKKTILAANEFSIDAK